MHYIVAALLTNLSYAIADNIAGYVANKNSPLKSVLWSSLLGLTIFFIPAITVFRHEFSKLTLQNTILILLINLLTIGGFFCFLTAMSKGRIILSGVIGGSFPAVTTVSSIILLSERLELNQILSIAMIIIGITISVNGFRFKSLIKEFRKSGAVFAILACLLWGLYYTLITKSIDQVGWFLPQYLSNLTGLIIIVILQFFVREKTLFKPPKKILWLAINVSLLISGTVLFNYAISKGQTSIVAPIAGSSPALFTVLAYIFFKDRLRWSQLVGVALNLLGLITLSYFAVKT